jgi:hypothetical protein
VAVVDEATTTEWLTTSKAARRLDCSANWIRTLASTDRLRAVQTPLGLLIDPSSVDELLRARDAGSPATQRPA